ncbi:DUF421 domain-containing protein [Virgibacillus salinus]|uniref:Uncharacterized membrane protein YcaP, DUF421 family n=1 Tax=Virgibacillus salinus TaxID=553311 RepID=A0A1H1EL54_9BACI|nr:DUF421 domain-containing protein [Virgibacillus salinus]SDQ89300.1 Uncharacterized membrane protein YcaP, DUF421 family [Virgibacillus salinus]
MQNLMPIFIETLFGFLALFILTKVLGKTQIIQLTAFDFIAALVLGELVGNAIFDDKAGIIEIAFAVLVAGIVLYLTEIITQKYKGTRSLLEGQPSIIIHKGKLIREEMKKNKLDINQLQHLLRSKDVFSISEVEYAILETDGTVSVMKKSIHQTTTKQDFNIAPKTIRLPITLINDGEVLWDNLKEVNLSEGWLEQELTKQEFHSVKEVFYAEWNEGKGELFVLPFTEKET